MARAHSSRPRLHGERPRLCVPSDQSGFTLIEVAVLVLVLGLLATYAIPKYFELRVAARNAHDEYSEAAITSVVKTLHLENVLNGNDLHPTMPEVAANLAQPDFYAGLTPNEWSYIPFVGGNLIVIYCPHAVAAVGRRVYIYFRINWPPPPAAPNWFAGSIVEFTGPHL